MDSVEGGSICFRLEGGFIEIWYRPRGTIYPTSELEKGKKKEKVEDFLTKAKAASKGPIPLIPPKKICSLRREDCVYLQSFIKDAIPSLSKPWEEWFEKEFVPLSEQVIKLLTERMRIVPGAPRAEED